MHEAIVHRCEQTGIAYQCGGRHVTTLSGKKLLFLHGLGGRGTLWHSLIAGLLPVCWYCLDLPGHGDSNEKALPSLEVLYQKIRQFVDFHALDHSIVVAHSLSGLVALRLLTESYFTKAILFSADQRITLHPKMIEQILSKSYNKEFFIAGFPRHFSSEKIEDVITPFSCLNIESTAENFLQISNWPLIDFNRITQKCLLIAGKEDKIISPRRSRQLAKHIPGAKISELDGVGHYPHLEATTRVVKLMNEFLR